MGRDPGMSLRVLLASGLLALAALGGLAGAEPPPRPRGALTLEALTQRMATSRGVTASFHEVKDLALLDAPLESSGMLYFVAPDRLLRHTTSPTAARLVVENGRITYRDTAGSEEIDLAENPVARQFVDNLIVLFNGNLPALRERYEIDFGADGSTWKLVLTPRRAAMRHFITRIALSGDGAALQQLVTDEADGDRTTTTFANVVTDHAFSATELEHLFQSAPDRRDP